MCLYNYLLFIYQEQGGGDDKKIVLNFCSCYNLSDFCDKFVLPPIHFHEKKIQVAAYMYFLLFVIFSPAPISQNYVLAYK